MPRYIYGENPASQNDFHGIVIHEIPATMAVDVGLINQEFLDAERERLGSMYPMYYECDFYNSSSTWYKPEMFQYSDYGGDTLFLYIKFNLHISNVENHNLALSYFPR